MRFSDRSHAGHLLAEKLKQKSMKGAVVLALPRGGVPVAAEIATSLKAELDILLVKKIGAPLNPELAVGAVDENGVAHWRMAALRTLGLSKKDLASLVEQKTVEMRNQAKVWRRDRKPLDVRGRKVVLVDDGLATGASMETAIAFLSEKSPKEIIVAVPVAPPATVARLKAQVDEVVVVFEAENFISVGQFYDNFTQVSDEEVTEILENWPRRTRSVSQSVEIFEKGACLHGELTLPLHPRGLIVFAHGSGSTHLSPRNQRVARALQDVGFGTLLFDLLTIEEAQHRRNVFDIALLTQRMKAATEWARDRLAPEVLPIGYFGASTGSAAALSAAAADPSIFAVVSRGGRPDLAENALAQVKAPTLLIVGGEDGPVITLNEKALKQLKSAEMVVVPGAGHLFEEKGTLDQVIEHACEWYSEKIGSRAIANPDRGEPAKDLLRAAKPLGNEGELLKWIEQMSRARVVMLGEATHGTEEFYRFRRLISQRLIEDFGFSFIAVEGDWPDCYRLNRYIKTGEGDSAEKIMSQFARWPTWMWANQETAALINWMRTQEAGFYGLDVYSLYESLDVLRKYIGKLNPDLIRYVEDAYACFEPFRKTEGEYVRTLLKDPEGCQKEILACLQILTRSRLEDTDLNGEELFDARQNAQVIRDAERYYRAMLFGGPDSWNIRDEHMMDTLDRLLRYHGEGSRAIVWAHNTHIGDYHATDMVKEGYINLGGLARERYGIENVYLVGFGTYEGQVLAGRAWGAEPEAMNLLPAAVDTIEDQFHQVAHEMGSDQLFVRMTGAEPSRSLRARYGHRAVGVVYQTEFEMRKSNYVPTDLAGRYDAFLFIDKTSALKMIPPKKLGKGLLPETWPVGQ